MRIAATARRQSPAPAPSPESQPVTALVLACGALARELKVVLGRVGNETAGVRLHCLPADLHNRPERIAPRVEAELARLHGHYDPIYVAYADCGTGATRACSACRARIVTTCSLAPR